MLCVRWICCGWGFVWRLVPSQAVVILAAMAAQIHWGADSPTIVRHPSCLLSVVILAAMAAQIHWGADSPTIVRHPSICYGRTKRRHRNFLLELVWSFQAFASISALSSFVSGPSRPDTHPQAPKRRAWEALTQTHFTHVDGSLPGKVRGQGAQPSGASFWGAPWHRRSRRWAGATLYCVPRAGHCSRCQVLT